MYREAILRELWEELDACVYRLMTDGTPTLEDPVNDWKLWGEERGKAQGLAFSIAVIYNMSEPDIEWVRAEAVRRWENELEGGTNDAVPAGLGMAGSTVRRRPVGCLAVAFGVAPVPCGSQTARGQHALF